MAKEKILVSQTPILKPGQYDVSEIVELNFFDLTGERIKQKNTSNKFYHIELNIEKNGTKAQLYTEYGPTGKVQAREYRCFDSVEAAKKEMDRIVKSKIKKGYSEIDVAQRVVGSEDAKKIIKPVVYNNLEIIKEIPKSTLDKETQRLMSVLFSSTAQFVATTLKCPLGQLSNNQINVGREKLNQARLVLDQSGTKDSQKILQLTNEFYSLIPHNLGSGARGKMTELLLDSKDKINKKEYDLDTLLDAKDLNIELTNSTIDSQYESLDTTFSFVAHNDNRFVWLNKLIQETRAHNHNYLGKINLLNAWAIFRNGESSRFLKTAEEIAGQCGKQIFPDKMKSLVESRPDGNSDLYKKANIIPLFHGTRTQNLTGIIKKGLLIRPSGVVLCGSMYGNGIYNGLSTKAINYSSINSSYWANGNDKVAYLFINDCILGNPYFPKSSGNYNIGAIAPKHSVWAKGGQSGVINDEMILYRTDQNNLKYLLEFSLS